MRPASLTRRASGKFELVGRIFVGLITNENLREFLTLAAYDHLD